MNRLFLTAGLVLATTPTFAQHNSPSHPRATRQATTHPAPLGMNIVVAGRVMLPNGKPAYGAHVYLNWTTEKGEAGLRQLGVDARGGFGLSFKLGSKLNGKRWP